MAEAIVTVLAREKMAQARTGEIPLSPIAGFAFGDGAVDASDKVISPSESDVALKHELLRKPIDGYKKMSGTQYRYFCTLEESDLAGEKINEIALHDSDGDLVAIKSFSSKGKDADLEMTFNIDDSF